MIDFFDPQETIYRQYSGSPSMRALIKMLGESFSANGFIDDLYTNIWDIQTANSHGLDIWGKILVLSRVMPYTSIAQWFGFKEALLDHTTATDPMPFDNYSFFSGNDSSNGNVVLTDDYYRRALMMKAMSNITDCTASNLNNMLTYIFGSSGRAWVESSAPRNLSYHFDFTPDNVELAIIQNGAILPRPAGCLVSYILEV